MKKDENEYRGIGKEADGEKGNNDLLLAGTAQMTLHDGKILTPVCVRYHRRKRRTEVAKPNI